MPSWFPYNFVVATDSIGFRFDSPWMEKKQNLNVIIIVETMTLIFYPVLFLFYFFQSFFHHSHWLIMTRKFLLYNKYCCCWCFLCNWQLMQETSYYPDIKLQNQNWHTVIGLIVVGVIVVVIIVQFQVAVWVWPRHRVRVHKFEHETFDKCRWREGRPALIDTTRNCHEIYLFWSSFIEQQFQLFDQSWRRLFVKLLCLIIVSPAAAASVAPLMMDVAWTGGGWYLLVVWTWYVVSFFGSGFWFKDIQLLCLHDSTIFLLAEVEWNCSSVSLVFCICCFVSLVRSGTLLNSCFYCREVIWRLLIVCCSNYVEYTFKQLDRVCSHEVYWVHILSTAVFYPLLYWGI